MAEERDPYAQVIEALWEMLEAKEGFSQMVRVGNRIKYLEGLGDPEKQEVSSTDLPEVRIVVARSKPGVRRSSSTTFDEVTFDLMVASGEQRLDVVHTPLKWLVFRATVDAQARLTTLRWKDRPFVLTVLATAVAEGITERDLIRGIKGWTAIWSIDVLMQFNTSDL